MTTTLPSKSPRQELLGKNKRSDFTDFFQSLHWAYLSHRVSDPSVLQFFSAATFFKCQFSFFKIVMLNIPYYTDLLGTAATVSVSCRALGGIVGITILTAVYNNKYTSYVGPLVASSPFVNPPYLDQSAEAWRYVWIIIACIVAATGFASCGLQSVQPMMNGHIESALENRKALRSNGDMDTDPASSDR